MKLFSHSSRTVSANHRNLFPPVRIVAALITILPPMFAAAGGPPPTTVVGHVSVEGVVEVLDDVLRQPFNKSAQVSTSATTGSVTFDVPLGKRLVIETIAIRAFVTTGSTQQINGIVVGQDGDVFIDIPVQAQGTVGPNDLFKAALPLKIRVDGTSAPEEIIFSFSRTGGGGSTLRVSIFGYLVDLTQ